MTECERLKSSQRWRSDDGTVLNKCRKLTAMFNLIEMFFAEIWSCCWRNLRSGDDGGTFLPLFTCSRWNTCRLYMYSFTCFCYKWCVNFSFGSWGDNIFLFHLFGIHVLSELSFPLLPLLSSRMHIDSEISLSLVRGTSETLFFGIKPYFISFHFSGF